MNYVKRRSFQACFLSLSVPRNVKVFDYKQVLQNRFLSASASKVLQTPLRNPAYSKVTCLDKEFFFELLGENGVLSKDTDELSAYNTDWLNTYKGSSSLVLRPNSVEEISEIMKYCNNKKLAIVPQGGNTGLVGGSVPVHDEIILSMNRMNRILEFDSLTGVLTCQAGCILAVLEEYLEGYDYTIPLDLGSKGSCQIGGNLATNAGGLRLLRYGTLHENCLGLEVVLADGTILSTLNKLRKNNTGPDLKQLFIGQEGLYGVITATSLLVPKSSNATNLVLLGISSFENVKQVYEKARYYLSEILSAIEFMDRNAVEISLEHGSDDGITDPMEDIYPFYMIIETRGSDNDHNNEKLENFTQILFAKEYACDGIMAQDDTQLENMWRMRESLAYYLQKHGHLYTYDVSLPLDNYYSLVEYVENAMNKFQEEIRVHVDGFGHLGDGNLHLNVVTPKYEKNVDEYLQSIIYPWVAKHKGSISAEHGVGQMKRSKIQYSQSKEAIDLMVRLKKFFDPNLILNPYKVLPEKFDQYK